ncbi:MAG: glycosyltransferase [Flavobacteriales bacterium]|nr:glycosyltransferase [Flavobacteriales bacterium]MCB9191799.1 glycosyltransferase [Flavobacteriales bacterium]
MAWLWYALFGLAVVVMTLYSAMIIYAISGWKKLKVEEETQAWLGVSILIAARNEAENIETVIRDIFNQSYAKELFELIVVDDHSEDETLSMAESLKAEFPNLKVLQNVDGEGKKAALQTGIRQAKFDTIATVDADCRVPSEWLITMTSHWEKDQTRMLLGPIVFQSNQTVLQQSQAMEMLAIMGLTGGFAAHQKPIMANGANLIFDKKSFEEIGGYGSSENPSGDDVFTMLQFSLKWPESVRFVKHYEAAVLTKPEVTFSAFWQQRKRWLSKKSGYSNWLVKGTALVTYLANLAALLSFMAIIVAFGSYWTDRLMWILFIKTLLDLILTRTVSRDLQPHCGIANILVSELFVVVYVTFLGIFGNVRNYVWKGREVKVK